MEDLVLLRDPLTKFVRRFVDDPHAAEDVVQDTLLRAVRHAGGYRGRAAFKSWVFTIARNLCRDLHRSRRTRLRLLDGPEPGRLDDPGERLDRDEARARVVEALGGLPAEARELLVLRLYLGLSYREIARRRGCPPSGVGTRLFRARRDLTRRLRDAE